MRSRIVVAAALIALTPLTGLAAQGAPALIPIPYRTYLAINPLGITFDVASIEIESGIANGITVGGLASYTDFDDDRFTTFEGKLRYYPGEVVLRGLSFGLSGGYTQYRTRIDVYDATPSQPTTQDRSIDFPTIGLITDYNWLTGAQKRFVIGTGLSAKRVIASASSRETVRLDRAYVTARFVLGIAF